MRIILKQRTSGVVAAFMALFLASAGFISIKQGYITLSLSQLQNIKIIFMSIILEALPFVLLGVFVSSVLQIFVTEETVRRWTPKNPFLGILFACLLGICFPLCECGMIPVVKRLIHKGMPITVGVVFILVGPVLNPVVYISTRMAFQTYPAMAYARMGLAFAVAIVLGLLIHFLVKKNPLRLSLSVNHTAHSSHQQDGHHKLAHPLRSYEQLGAKLIAIFKHASVELFQMGTYLIIGSILTALVQTSLSRDDLIGIGSQSFVSSFFMMGYAYILSLCSTSDAFVASSFATTFSKSSLLAFLLFGPMIDLKVTLMLHSMFKTRFVLLLIALVAGLVYAGTLAVHYLGLIV
ncbi:permease [Paenibacillus sp. SI8]|uniref:permease n=1 Tax=unclassified Paenibacillus TaxID=185978 RepID=UPI0034663E93